MTNARKSREKRRQEAPTDRPQRSKWIERGVFALVAVGIVVAAASIWRIGGAGTTAEAGPVHVHGLGVDPADGVLYIATHTGLFRVGDGESKATRVGDSHQDTMGFTVVGKNRFFGSGHPDLREDLPPLLGLIESTNAGRSWDSVSLLGEVDFHVLRSAGDRVYGYDVTGDRLLVSTDQGQTWEEVQRPAPLIDLAADPEDSRHVLGAGAGDLGQGLYESHDGGQTWERRGDPVGLLAWSEPDRVFLVDGNGDVSSSTGAGDSFELRGSIGGQPAAFLGVGDELYVALHDGTIKRSTDGGTTWVVRSMP